MSTEATLAAGAMAAAAFEAAHDEPPEAAVAPPPPPVRTPHAGAPAGPRGARRLLRKNGERRPRPKRASRRPGGSGPRPRRPPLRPPPASQSSSPSPTCPAPPPRSGRSAGRWCSPSCFIPLLIVGVVVAMLYRAHPGGRHAVHRDDGRRQQHHHPGGTGARRCGGFAAPERRQGVPRPGPARCGPTTRAQGNDRPLRQPA